MPKPQYPARYSRLNNFKVLYRRIVVSLEALHRFGGTRPGKKVTWEGLSSIKVCKLTSCQLAANLREVPTSTRGHSDLYPLLGLSAGVAGLQRIES